MDLVEEFARLGKALKWKIYYFIVFSAQASTLGVFFISTTRFRPVNSFVAQKSSEMSPLSGSSPVFVSQPFAPLTFLLAKRLHKL